MTKKAAKKKQTTKKAPKKVSSSGEDSPEAGEVAAPDKSAVEKEPTKTGEESSNRRSNKSERQIEVVEESAPEAEAGEPKRKMGRVPQPDGGRKRDSSRSRSNSGRRGGGKRNSGPRPQVDQEELGKKAWKIFQHEIAEEGLALIDEISARQLAEKSLAVTRAFLEERERRLGKSKQDESAEEKPGERPSRNSDKKVEADEAPAASDEAAPTEEKTAESDE